VENGVFYAFVNNTSSEYPDGRKITGRSFVASPQGDILVEGGEEEEIIECRLDLSVLNRARSRWPFLKDVLEGKHKLNAIPRWT